MTSLKHVHVYVDHNDSTATSDHSAATSDHSAATSDHSAVTSDHSAATSDHSAATSDHSAATSDHSAATSDHSAATSDHSAGSTVCGSNKRTVTWEIIKSFISQYDKKFHTLQWLDFQCEVMESIWLG